MFSWAKPIIIWHRDLLTGPLAFVNQEKTQLTLHDSVEMIQEVT